ALLRQDIALALDLRRHRHGGARDEVFRRPEVLRAGGRYVRISRDLAADVEEGSARRRGELAHIDGEIDIRLFLAREEDRRYVVRLLESRQHRIGKIEAELLAALPAPRLGGAIDIRLQVGVAEGGDGALRTE